MPASHNEAFSRVLIDKALENSGWNLLDERQVLFEQKTREGRIDYLLKDNLGRVFCVLEAKREELDPYDAKEQARGYAEALRAPFVILSNGREHWFWNFERADQKDAYRIERLPSREDLNRLRLKNLQPPRVLETEIVGSDFLQHLRHDLSLRGYQIRAMNEIAKTYDAGERKFLLEMATGTGKTLLCAALVRQFLTTRNAERVLFIVDRIELAKQTMEDFNVVLAEFKPVIYKTARKTGEMIGSSVVIATIQSLLTDRRYRDEFTPFYFDLVVNDEAHRSIYGDAREVVQFFQATRIGLTATPKAYLKNINIEKLAIDDPKALEARQLRDTYHYFGCEPGQPTFRYDIIDAVQDPQGPYLCLPKIIDCRSDITTQALQEAGWSVLINEQEETFKVRDLEKKVFTPHRNRVMCEAFLREAQRDPSGNIGKSIIFAVNQTHATNLTKILNDMKPGIAMTITSRVPEASTLAKDFRDNRRKEAVAVSVDMLSTGYNCRDLLNVILMRPIFSPIEYIQIKGRGTRRFTFVVGNTEYEKKHFFLIDFCAVAEYFEERYDYSAPLELPREPKRQPTPTTVRAETATTTSDDRNREPSTEMPSRRRELAMAEKCVTNAGGTWLFCDTDSIAVVASPKGGTVYPKRPEEECKMDQREIAPIPVLRHADVLQISRRFRSLNPYSFGGDLLKVEDVNYEDGNPKTGSLRTVHGYAISAKRYALMEGSKIIEVKGHGLGYLMSPASSDQPDWMETAWQYDLCLDQVLWDGADPPWLDYPAMMKIPVSSPAVLGRLKGFCKPFDFVLAPILRNDKLDPGERAEKPILITRFNKHSDEWLDATYYNVRTGEKCRITVGTRKKGRMPVKTYREILHQYLYHPECKFAGPDGRPCDSWTRGILQRRHIIATELKCCGKELKRKLEQGPVDHETDFKVKVYANGRVTADPETLRALAWIIR